MNTLTIYGQVANDFIDASAKTPQYILFLTGARKGSIAKVESFTSRKNHYGYSYNYMNIYDVVCKWDDRKQTVTLESIHDKIQWIKGYSGPTVYSFVKKDKQEQVPIPVVKDMLGYDIAIDDVILYTLKSTVFGVVTRITEKGTVMFKPFATSEGQYIRSNNRKEKQSYSTSNILVIRDGLKKDLVLKRLTIES